MTDDRYAHYDRAYYIGRPCPESQSYAKHILRPGDMGAALCYAFGIDSYKDVCSLLRIPPDNPCSLSDMKFQMQLWAIRSIAKRQPKITVDVGCGRGELLAALWMLRTSAIGVEPSPAAQEISNETLVDWRQSLVKQGVLLLQCGAGIAFSESLIDSYGESIPYDTVIFVESIEHIPADEFALAYSFIRRTLRKTNGRLIITNWIDYHPIIPDGTGWDHVRLVDDAFYDSLAKDARRTIFRQGSHLVLEF